MIEDTGIISPRKLQNGKLDLRRPKATPTKKRQGKVSLSPAQIITPSTPMKGILKRGSLGGLSLASVFAGVVNLITPTSSPQVMGVSFEDHAHANESPEELKSRSPSPPVTKKQKKEKASFEHYANGLERR